MSGEVTQWLIEVGDWALQRPSQQDKPTTELVGRLLQDSEPGDKLAKDARVDLASEKGSDDIGDSGDSGDSVDDEDDEDDEGDEDDEDDEIDDEIEDEIEDEIDNSNGGNHDSESESDKEIGSTGSSVTENSREHHSSNKFAVSHPEVRLEEQQSFLETKEWKYLRHITISRDQTHAGACEREKLAALRHDPCNSSTFASEIPRTGAVQPENSSNSLNANENFQNRHLVLMILEMQQKKARMMERQIQGKAATGSWQPKVDTIVSKPTGDTHEDPGKGEEQSNALRIAQLEEEIQKLRSQQNSLKSTTWLVFHKIQDQSSSYFAEPSWTINRGSQLRLVGNSPLTNEAEYLRQRPDVAFVIYKYYEHDHQDKAIKKAKAEGAMLPSPAPVREAIQLLSKQMISAVDAFITAQPTSQVCFPDWNSKKPIESPFLFWYCYRSAGCLDGFPEPARSQMRLLTGWIDQNYNVIYTKAESEFDRGEVSWLTMPFFVQPGQVLVSKNSKGIQGYIAQSWATKHGSHRYSPSFRDEPAKISQSWSVDVWSYEYDGRFYRHSTSLKIKLEFDDDNENVDMAKLRVLPLRFGGSDFQAKLDHRGRTMWECRYRRLVAYKDGVENDISGEGERYMVDFDTYKRLHSDSHQFKTTYPFLGRADRKEMDAAVMNCEDPPQGPELLVFPSTIIGYNLRQKKWRNLEVDSIQGVSWNKQAFEHLVINPDTKDLIQALVTSKLESEESTDFIQGKGNGLIILLHGGPGTGKTFTAESVAEIAEKPLYRVTCGDIGTKPEQVEKYLESVLHLGNIWGCVVLLDEADVFLEQRTLTDLERNALVSVFLRVLEYYEGILILTSNRVGTFDEAFKSRIQLSLHYETLSKPQRRVIWSNFLNRLKMLERDNTKIEPIEQRKRKLEETKGINFDDIERHLGDLAGHEMNGRQIRNAITTARQLAKFKGDRMAYHHLEHVITTSMKFDKYLESVRDNYTDDQMARDVGIR